MKRLRFEAKKPYDFDRNKKARYLKKNSQIPQEKTAKI